MWRAATRMSRQCQQPFRPAARASSTTRPTLGVDADHAVRGLRPRRGRRRSRRVLTRLLAERVRMRGPPPSPIKRGQRITVPGLPTSPPATNPSRHRSDRSDCVQAPFRSPGRSVNRLSTSQNKIRFSCFQFDFGTKILFPNFLLHLRYFATCNMDVKIVSDWKEILAPEFEKTPTSLTHEFVRQEYATRRIFPPGSNIFRAFDKCPFEELKVVIIGQDPITVPDRPTGSVSRSQTAFPSRIAAERCIFKEVHDDTSGEPIPASGNLDRKLGRAGRALLNAVLTVRAHRAPRTPGTAERPPANAVVRAIAEAPSRHRLHDNGAVTPRKKGAIATRSATSS